MESLTNLKRYFLVAFTVKKQGYMLGIKKNKLEEIVGNIFSVSTKKIIDDHIGQMLTYGLLRPVVYGFMPPDNLEALYEEFTKKTGQL